MANKRGFQVSNIMKSNDIKPSFPSGKMKIKHISNINDFLSC